MNECIYCGESVPGTRYFCDSDCMEDWKKGQFSSGGGIRFLPPGESLPPKEREKRCILFARARKGNAGAKRVLRRDYGLTGLWNGEEMVSL